MRECSAGSERDGQLALGQRTPRGTQGVTSGREQAPTQRFFHPVTPRGQGMVPGETQDWKALFLWLDKAGRGSSSDKLQFIRRRREQAAPYMVV